jgi:Mn2+/Fe2+ NRAMP family transporter
MARQRRERADDAVQITSAARGHSDDIGHRQRRYVISMTVRTVCFVLAVVFRGLPVLMWAFIVASFVLPYVAVVMANAGASTDPGNPEYVDPDLSRPALGPGTHE